VKPPREMCAPRLSSAPPLVPIHTSSKRKHACVCKKRVRFDDEAECSRSLKRRSLDIVPASSEWSEAEKSRVWFSDSESKRLREESNNDAHEFRRSDNKMILLGQPHFCFRETYANIFAVCNLNVGEDDDMCSFVSPEIVTFMAINEARGLEDRTAPRVAVERRLLRVQQVKLVLQAQSASKDPESVRNVARAMSRPSRKLAEALGIIDATAAMMYYLDASSNGSHEQHCNEKHDDSTIRRSTLAPAAIAPYRVNATRVL
jgi:hypothetical protein